MSTQTTEGTGPGSVEILKPRILNGVVKTVNLATDAVVNVDVADSAISTAELAALAVTTAKLDALAVTTAKLDALAVTQAKIANTALSKAPVVLNTSVLTLTAATHANVPLILTRAAGVVATLPAASGSGNNYKFYVDTTVTTNAYIINVANATDVMTGVAFGSDDESALAGTPTAIDMWVAGATSDTLTMDGSTRGGLKGNYVEILDIAAGLFHVKAVLTQTGTEVTPFSAAVS